MWEPLFCFLLRRVLIACMRLFQRRSALEGHLWLIRPVLWPTKVPIKYLTQSPQSNGAEPLIFCRIKASGDPETHSTVKYEAHACFALCQGIIYTHVIEMKRRCGRGHEGTSWNRQLTSPETAVPGSNITPGLGVRRTIIGVAGRDRVSLNCS